MMRNIKQTHSSAWGITPPERLGDPILGPRPASRFRCPLGEREVQWEGKDVFNPAAVVRDGRVYMLYRAEDHVGVPEGTSRLGLAISDDGIHFERHDDPVLYPDDDCMAAYEWQGGCEDPRLVEDENGRYVLTYTAFDGKTARLAVATSEDLRNWTKHGLAFAGAGMENQFCKAGSIICRVEGERLVATRIQGQYWMYWLRPGTTFAATSTDLINWRPVEMWGRRDRQVYDRDYPMHPFTGDAPPADQKSLKPVVSPRRGRFDHALVEPGPPAVLTDAGIVLIYDAWNRMPGGDANVDNNHYTVGQVLMDPEDPTAVLARDINPIMRPRDPFEIQDAQLVPATFVSSLIRFNDRWLVYYGTADRFIAVARTEWQGGVVGHGK